MQQAAAVCAQLDANDEELMEYGNHLRRTIFEAYSGILQGFKDSKPDVMLPYASHLLQFIEVVFLDRQRYCFLFFSFLFSPLPSICCSLSFEFNGTLRL
jgi:hypothetical protein